MPPAVERPHCAISGLNDGDCISRVRGRVVTEPEPSSDLTANGGDLGSSQRGQWGMAFPAAPSRPVCTRVYGA